MADLTQRLRDPIHGLITFDEDSRADMLAWRLIQTTEFQRLRRIKQLGISDFVFPGATHSRFVHSIGVYHNARKLMNVIKKTEGEKFDKERADAILIAALLHDIGHGPFSHAFEEARMALARTRGKATIEKHEKFTAKLLLAEDGQIRKILDQHDTALAENIAKLFSAEDPVDIYHAVVSSSFDADRLDYLMRDRYMTGTEAGSIDYDWLIDNLDTYLVQVRQDDDDEPRSFPTFVFKSKGRQAAEDFLLARYRLYTQVYLHKTTRGFEKVITALIQNLGRELDNGSCAGIGLDDVHPLVTFLKPNGETINNYRDLDDVVFWGAVERLRYSSSKILRELSMRLWDRKRLEVLDVFAEIGHNPENLLNACRRLEEHTKTQLGKTVFKDEPSYNLYSRIGGESTKEHKMVRVRTPEGIKEITDFPDTVISKELMKKTRLTRYFFLSADDKDAARKVMDGR